MSRMHSKTMKYLGIKNKAAAWWDGRDWVDHKPYVSCPSADVDKQMECSKYEPCDTSEWLCVHCECGQSDVCDVRNMFLKA